MNIVHTYINNMYIDKEDNFAEKWHLTGEQEQGNEVTLICGSNENKRKEYVWKGIKVIELPILFQLTTSTRILKGLVKELMNIKADIFHTHHYCSFVPEITAVIGKIRKIPTVITIHNPFNEQKGLVGLFEKAYLVCMQPSFMLYNKVYFISNYLKNKKCFLVSKHKKEVLYNYFKPMKKIDIERKKNTILFLGRIDPVKGIDILLKAMVLIKDVKLRIVGMIGSNSYLKEISNFIIDNKLDVTLVGALYGEDKLKELYSNSVLVVPSRSEGFGNVAKEGLLCNIPTIVSNNGALPEVVNYNKDMIFTSVEDLAEKIILRLGKEQKK